MPDKNTLILAGFAGLLLIAGGCCCYYYTMKPAPKPVISRQKPVAKPIPSPSAVTQKAEKRGTVSTQPITEFDPATVYSGSLGEVTGLIAGRELSKVAYDLKSNEVKLKELESRLISEQPVMTIPPQVSVPAPAVSGVPEKPAEKEPVHVFVSSVMGSGSSLRAVLKSKAGRYLVRLGDVIPGMGKVSRITPESVEVSGKPLPWM